VRRKPPARAGLPIIALLTDFGTRDHYVGAMRGVALGICPDATLVDITHEVAAQDVLGGALELAAAYKYFPQDTIFLCVVDPGVGSGRRGLAAEAGGYRFVAPDNGLLTIVFREAAPSQVVELGNPQYARPVVSRTFEGRDRFAPAAAWLANGIELQALGTPVAKWEMLAIAEPIVSGGELRGIVVRIDRFGNLITNVDRRSFDAFAGNRRVDIDVDRHRLERQVQTYAETETGSLCALFGSSDHLEIAVNGGHAARRLGVSRGASVVVRLKADST
jgi:S-adenosyl-L-methionine hydrolase (adenosine-forming)